MSTHDVAVIGAGIAGLTAAAYLTKSGRKVVVLDPAPEAGGVLAAFERSGFVFPGGPAIARGFGRGGPYRALFALLGTPHADPPAARPYQVVLPEHRLTVFPEQRQTLEELRREFGREIDPLARLYREIGSIAERNARNGLAAMLTRWRSASEFLRSHRFSRDVEAFFDVQAQFFHGTGLGGLSLAAFVDMLHTAPGYVPGSYHALAARLRHAIVNQGGECRLGEPWPEIRFLKNRIDALGTSREIIEPRAVILNAHQDASLHNLYLGMRAEGIPVGMLDTVLALPSYDRPGDILSLSVASRDEGQVPAAGLRAVTASWRCRGAAKPGQAAALEEHVRSIMPFYADACVLSREETFSTRRFPLPGQVQLKTGRPDADRTPWLRSAVKNLYLLPDGAPTTRSIEAGRRVAAKLS